MIPFPCCSFTGTHKYVSANFLKAQSEEGKLICCLLVLNCILVLGMTWEHRKVSQWLEFGGVLLAMCILELGVPVVRAARF